MIKNRDTRLTIWLLIPVVLVLVAYVLYPSARTFIESLQKDGSISLGNYQDFFVQESKTNLEALWNSVYISILSVLVSALIGIPLAFIFNRYDFPGRSFFSSAAILPIVLPSLVGLWPLCFYMENRD